MNNQINLDNREKIENIQVDIMRYTPNKLSFWLCILAILLNCAMFLIIYTNAKCVPNVQLAIDLLVNICFILACFLYSEKTKAYDAKGGYVCIAIGVIEILRLFWIPFVYKGNGLSGTQFTSCIILFVLAGLSLIFAGIVAIIKQDKLAAHLKEVGGAE